MGELIPSPAKGQAVEVKVRDLDILGDKRCGKISPSTEKTFAEFLA